VNPAEPHPELERRYRRLLAWYPPDHRRTYEEEMLGVLLAGATPRQRWPRLQESANLVASAMRQRLLAVGSVFVDPRWRAGTAAVGLLVPMLLLTLHLRLAVGYSAWAREADVASVFPPRGWLAMLAWGAVIVFVLVRWRVVAAALAWAVAVSEGVDVATRYATAPVDVLYAICPVLLALTAAAALSVPGSEPALDVVGRRALALFAAAGALLVVIAANNHHVVATVTTDGIAWTYDMRSPSLIPSLNVVLPGPWAQPVGMFQDLRGIVVAWLTLVLGALGLSAMAPSVRRRMVALLAPVAALVAVIGLGFDGFAASSVRFTPPVLLAPEQWGVLAVTPVLTFLLAAAAVRRADRREELVHLGLAAERNAQ